MDQNPGQDRPDALRDIREGAERIADEARDAAEQSRPTALSGGKPELVPRAHPAVDLRGSGAIHRADRVRAGDDVDTAERQEDLADSQARIAETLQRSAEGLQQGREALESTGARVALNAGDVESVAEGAESLREDVSDLHEQARDVDPDER